MRRWVCRFERAWRRSFWVVGGGVEVTGGVVVVQDAMRPRVWARDEEAVVAVAGSGRLRFLLFEPGGVLLFCSSFARRGRVTLGNISVSSPSSPRPMMPLPEQLGSSRIAPTLAKRGSNGSRRRKSWPGRGSTFTPAGFVAVGLRPAVVSILMRV